MVNASMTDPSRETVGKYADVSGDQHHYYYDQDDNDGCLLARSHANKTTIKIMIMMFLPLKIMLGSQLDTLFSLTICIHQICLYLSVCLPVQQQQQHILCFLHFYLLSLFSRAQCSHTVHTNFASASSLSSFSFASTPRIQFSLSKTSSTAAAPVPSPSCRYTTIINIAS